MWKVRYSKLLQYNLTKGFVIFYLGNYDICFILSWVIFLFFKLPESKEWEVNLFILKTPFLWKRIFSYKVSPVYLSYKHKLNLQDVFKWEGRGAVVGVQRLFTVLVKYDLGVVLDSG